MVRQLRTAGAHPNEVEARLWRSRVPPLSIGRNNTVLHNSPMIRVASYQEIVDLVAGELGGDLPQFGWQAGDGNAPSHWLGAANTTDRLSVTGSPTAGTTPWISSEGAVASEVYDGSSYRSTATTVDPALTDDVVVLCIFQSPGVAAGHERVLCTQITSRGYFLSFEASGRVYFFTFADSNSYSRTGTGIVHESQYIIALGVLDRSGDMALVVNNTIYDEKSSPAGSLVGDGVAIGARPNGHLPISNGAEILIAAAWYGAGIADTFNADSYAFVKEITSRLEGTYPLQGETPTVTRASAAASLSGRAGESGRKYWITSSGLARAGDDGGLRAAPGSTNELYNTVNPDATTGWDKTGGGATAATLDAGVDDETALETCHEPNGDEVDATCFGPNVFKLDNSAGDAAAYAYSTVQTGDTDTRCTQVIARQTGSGGAELGWRDASSGAFTSLVSVRAGGEYERILSEGDTPPDTDAQTAIHAPAGTVVYFVVPDRRSEDIFVSREPIPNWATAAGATRADEVITLSYEPSDGSGSIAADVTPLGWSGTEPGADVSVITRATTPGDIITADGSTAGYLTGDGTSEAQATRITPVDGVERTALVRWRSGSRMGIDIDGDAGSTEYDDALDGAGVLRIAPTAAEIAIRNIIVKDS